MQGLVNFTTAIADGIAVLLPALCYLAACGCFCFFAWTLWTWSEPHSRHHHHHIQRPWVPWVSLVLCGVFASFPKLLTMADVSPTFATRLLKSPKRANFRGSPSEGRHHRRCGHAAPATSAEATLGGG